MSIPSWKWVLSAKPFSTRLYQYIDQFSWVDKHLCKLLFPRPSPDSFRYAAEAILYQREQTTSFARFLSTLACSWGAGCDCATVNFRIMPDFDEDTMMEPDDMMHNKALLIKFIKNSLMIKLPFRLHWASVNEYVSIYESAHGPQQWYVEKSASVLASCDCVIHVVDAWSFDIAELAVTIGSLAPHQQLVIAVVVGLRLDEFSRMECLANFLQSIGGFARSWLTAVPTNWRLWCIKRQGSRFIGNFSSLIKWGCYDVLSKKGGGGEGRNNAPSSSRQCTQQQ
ncbi:hypothetical protein TcWFU_005083 [Taenia crassiceps]|uniref:Uncharacterized protein n=1 Tax=Taenia crassiceps TaxID=6207 RepID=A0ABR4Q1V2_9CEST